MAPAADLIDAALDSLPRRGLISGADLVLLQGLVSLLRDPNLLLEHGQKIIDGSSPADLLPGLAQAGLPEDDLGPEPPLPLPEPGSPYLDSLGLW